LANLVLGEGPAHHLVAPGHSEVTITIRGIGGPLAINTIAVADGGSVKVTSKPGTVADSIADSIRRLSISRPLAIDSIAEADGGGVKVSRGSVAETKSNAIRRLSLPLAIAMSMAGETIRIGSRANRAIAIAMSRVNLGKAHRSDSGTSDSIAIRRLGISRPLADTIADAVSDSGGVQISSSPGTVADSISVRRLSISRPLANAIADAVSDGGGVEISSGPGTVADSIADSIRRLSIGRPLAIGAIADAISDGGGVKVSTSPGTVADSIRRFSISRPLAIGSVADAVSDGGGVEISRSPVAESIAIRRLSLPLAIAAIANAIVESLGATVREADSGVGVETDAIAVRSIGGPLADSVSVSVASIAAVSETKTLDAPLGAAHPGGVKSHSVADRRLSLPLAVSLGGPRLGVDSAIRVVRESSQSNTTVQTDSIRGLSLPLAVSSVSIPKSIPH